jgi:hypothetical protein
MRSPSSVSSSKSITPVDVTQAPPYKELSNVVPQTFAHTQQCPQIAPVLKPPVNLNAVNRGCIDGLRTRWDLYWANHPDTTAAVTHYDIWKSHPTSQPYVYGWTVYSTFSDSYLIGANARWRVNACSGGTCSELSPTSVEVFSMCSGG